MKTKTRILTVGALVATMSAVPATAQTSDEETGAEVAKQVETEIGLYDAPVATDYVEAIGMRMVGNLENNPYAFKFHIVDQFSPNAFAVPGGWVYVSRGLMVLANTEDELAGVIGHEITHVTERHSAHRQRRGMFGAVLQIPGNVVGAVVGEDLGNLLNAPIKTIGQVSLATYSRGQETEADRLGMRLAAGSGYDPLALADILDQLEAEVELLTGEQRKASFFDSHPTTPDRVENINSEARKIEWSAEGPVASDQRGFLAKLDGMWLDENPAQGLFRDERFYQPDLGFTITFPEGWTTLNTPSYVGAYTEDETGVVLVAIAGDASPSAYAAEFVDRLKEEHGMGPMDNRAVESDGWSGHYVTLAESSPRGGERSYLHYLWARLGGVTFQLLGAGADRYRPALRATAVSLRPLNETDWESVTALRLRIVEAHEGETIEQVGKRTGNGLPPEFTALINNLDLNQRLESGTLVKIAREERYQPH